MLRRDVRPHAGVWLGEEIGVAVHLELGRVEHEGVEVQVGRICPVARPDVADVVGAEVDQREMEGRERSSRRVRDVTVRHPEQVDLEGVDVLHGFLPATLLDGDLVPHLRPRLADIEVQDGPIEPEVGGQRAVQKGAPVNARVQPGNACDRRLGVRGLSDRGVEQVQGAPGELEAQVTDVDAIARQAGV